MLKDHYTALLLGYTTDKDLVQQCWKELETAYSNEERYFHNLGHLEQLAGALLPVKDKVADWDTMLFALFYHDIAYDVVQYVLENDNEESSAAIATETLTRLGVPAARITLCSQHIMATKTHLATNNDDTNFFTDADLSILGQPWETYHTYMKNIRKEYATYPDPIYHSGRIKVLQHFLKMSRVYKTDHFYTMFENTARENMEREMEVLSTL